MGVRIARPRSLRGTPAAPPPVLGRGWEITPSQIGLVGKGISRASLTTYTGPSTIASGTTLDGYHFTSPVTLASAGNITIRNFLMTGMSVGDCFTMGSPTGPITFEDGEVDGSASAASTTAFATAFRTTGGAGFVTIKRVHAHGLGRVWWLDGAGLVEHCIHDQAVGFGDPATTGSHNECVTRRNSGSLVTYRDCRFDILGASENASAAFQIISAGGTAGDVRMEGCQMLHSGFYAFTAETNPGSLIANSIAVVNNRWPANSSGYNVVDANAISEWSSNSRYLASNPPNYNGTVVAAP